MPNWCSNSLTVTGPGTSDFFAAVEAAPDGDFIDHLIPMPGPIKSMHTGSCKIGDSIHRTWREAVGPDGKAVNVAIPEIELAHLVDLYGTADWHEWAKANWGTKWSACEVDTISDDRLVFDSAWAPPEVAIQTISAMFPDATFLLAYAEGGMGYYGSATYQNGVVIDSFEGVESFWNELTDEQMEDNEIDPVNSKVREFLDNHSLHTGG